MIKIFDVASARKTILDRSFDSGGDYPASLLDGIAARFGRPLSPQQAVSEILASVRKDGDRALLEWSEKLDGVEQPVLRLEPSELAAAKSSIPDKLLKAMQFSIDRIRAFHERQPIPDWTTGDLGGMLGQRFTPIRRVGVYVPAGTAPLPSSLLMSVVPALVAGVNEIVVCTPPGASTAIFAAASLCGVEEVYLLGGAQAIAAMAYGTESIARVDKIVGAGNLFVTLAKQQVYGVVGLDGLAGPTETMILADQTARAAWVAADLLAQAEHDPLASAILLTPDGKLGIDVQAEVERQASKLSRVDILAQSLAQKSGIVITPDMETAVQLANEYAAEHLCLSVADPQALLTRLSNAGGYFLGERSFEVLGDYVAGPSHVMPTGGTARFASPLNLLDFVKLSSVIALDAATSQAISPFAAEIADAETLTAHAAAARIRLEASDE
jgi:histidinol dehydrogenase